MDDLNEIVIFAKVAQAGSFTRAAHELGMPKSTVSRKVTQLEERLGALLLQRTTRTLSVTDAGRAFLQHALRVLAEVEAAELAVSRLQEVPLGPLRVTAPLSFGFLGPVLSEFLGKHPKVELDLVCTDRVVDLVDEGFDVAIRAGALHDSSLIARQLCALQSVVVGSPALVRRLGEPKSPRALEKHEVLMFGVGSDRSHWTLTRGDEALTIAVRPRFVANDLEVLEAAAAQGLGFALLPAFRCHGSLKSKALVRVLPKWASRPLPVSVVYSSARLMSPKLRAFVDHMRDAFSPPPWER